MHISHTSTGTVLLKTKTEQVNLGSEVTIGSYTVPGAGEYDIATIQCESYNLARGTAYIIRAEDLVVTFLSEISAEVGTLDDASNTDILVVDVRSNNTVDELKPIVKALEPAYLFLIGEGATPEFASLLNLPLGEAGSLKVSKTGLPLEGTSLIPRP